MNHWDSTDVESLKYNEKEGFYVDGHEPFGPDNYPNAKNPSSLIEQLTLILIITVILAIIIISIVFINKKKKR